MNNYLKLAAVFILAGLLALGIGFSKAREDFYILVKDRELGLYQPQGSYTKLMGLPFEELVTAFLKGKELNLVFQSDRGFPLRIFDLQGNLLAESTNPEDAHVNFVASAADLTKGNPELQAYQYLQTLANPPLLALAKGDQLYLHDVPTQALFDTTLSGTNPRFFVTADRSKVAIITQQNGQDVLSFVNLLAMLPIKTGVVTGERIEAAGWDQQGGRFMAVVHQGGVKEAVVMKVTSTVEDITSIYTSSEAFQMFFTDQFKQFTVENF